MLVCLLLTAALSAAVPSLWRGLTGPASTRVSDRLRPARQQTLSVWLIADTCDASAWLRRELAAFEKLHPGVRTFLRRADAQELYAQGAALPDVALFSTGAVTRPEAALLALAGDWGVRADALSAGQYRGEQYALPLCFAPMTLCVPERLLASPDRTARATATPKSHFSFQTASPVQPKQTPAPPEIPWDALADQLAAPEGTALQQLLLTAPAAARAKLIARVGAQWNADGEAIKGDYAARALPLAQAQKQEGERFALTPAVSDRVLLGALTRQSESAAALLQWLLSEAAQGDLAAHGLYPLREGAALPQGDALTRELSALYGGPLLLANAFSCAAAERAALCRAGFLAGGDPVETLLQLR